MMIGENDSRKIIRFLLRDHLVNQNTHLVPKIENAEKPFSPAFMRLPELQKGIKNGDERIRRISPQGEKVPESLVFAGVLHRAAGRSVLRFVVRWAFSEGVLGRSD